MKVHTISFLVWSLRSILSAASGADETLIGRILKDSNDQSAGQWSSLTPNLDFARILGDSKYDKVTEQILRTLSSSTEPVASSSSCSFLPSTDYYPEYAVAWRYLGISVDCNYQGNGHRSLENNNGNSCARVLLYAVYVDVNHDESLGLDQYSFYDRKSGTWGQCAGKYTIDYKNNPVRCVKMDCHSPDTQNFKLLGLYKNYEMNQWMEQLFKHEGVCVWSDDEYNIAQNSREMVNANNCNAAGYDANSNVLYGGVGPLPGGNIGVTLFSDATCNVLYTGTTTIDSLCAGTCSSNNNNNKNRDLKNENGVCGYYCAANSFNDAMNVWKQCQPCTAYTPGYYGNYGCNDSAGYNNCLQCMKFKNKANSVPADLADLYTANIQSGITSIDVCGQTFGEFGYGYEGGVPSFSESMKIQKDALNLVPSYNKPPADASMAFFIISIIAVIAASAYLAYQFVVTSNLKGAAGMKGNDEGIMT